MPVLVRALTPADRSEWEDFASNCSDATPFHTFDWEEILRLGCEDANVVYWSLWDENRLSAIWPVSLHSAFGGKILFSLFHSSYGSPIAKPSTDARAVQILTKNIIVSAKKHGALHWTLDMPVDSNLLSTVSTLGFKAKASQNCIYRIDTRMDVDSLWSNLSKKTRNSVRKAGRDGLEVQETTELEGLMSYYEVYKSTMSRRNIDFLNFEFFKILHQRMINGGKAKLILALDDSRIVAGMIVLLHNGKAHWWSGASLREAWKKCPNELLLWNTIKWASESSIRSFDLGPTPSDPSSGLNMFKRHFGGQQTDQIRLTWPVNRLRSSLVTGMVSAYRHAREYGLVPEMISKILQREIWFD